MTNNTTMTNQELIENLNLQNKCLIRSFRKHSNNGRKKLAQTIHQLIMDNNNKILNLMK